MSSRHPLLLAVPALSLLSVLVACGGGIESSKSEQGIEGTAPPAGSSSGSPGKPVGGQCKALPTCDAGDDQVSGPSGCLQDEARCYEREKCGTTIWCTGGGISTCAAYPSCDPGYLEVPSCTTKDCVAKTLCGSTIYCRLGAQCDGYPSCDPGHTKVPGPAQCLQDDAVCYPRSLCGMTIWCTGPAAADAGSP